MPVNYAIPNVMEIATPCLYCGGRSGGCQYCRKPTCLQCGGIVQGHGCRSCYGTERTLHSDLIEHPHISLPDIPSRGFAGEQPVTQPIIQLSRRNR